MADSPPRLRVRRHTDGRVALKYDTTLGWIVAGIGCQPHWSGEPNGDGWVELFVAELPQPDKHDVSGKPVWVTELEGPLLPFVGSVSIEGEEPVDSSPLRTDALKILAAVNHSELLREESTR